MSADDFFSRWSRRAAETKAASVKAQEAAAAKMPVGTDAGSLPQAVNSPAVPCEVTLEDVAALTPDSNYSEFVAKGVDEAVKRSAMKKLFSDPHFNVMDGLDIYIDDYSVFEPITPAALALMEHAKPLLDPLGQIRGSMMSLLQQADEQEKGAAESVDGGAPSPSEEKVDYEETPMQTEMRNGPRNTEAEPDGKPISAELIHSAKPAE